MLRYIAFAWNAAIPDRASLAANLRRRLEVQLPKWPCALEAPGLLVFHAGADTSAAQAYKLAYKGGVVFGNLFERTGVCLNAAISESETRKLQCSHGQHLVENCWGRYVAFVREDHGPRLWILRDPTGAIPCFVTEHDGIHIVFSHVEDSAQLGLIGHSINWNHIAAYLWFDHLVTAETGLDDVRQLHAGERVQIDADSAKYEFCWHPGRFCGSRFVGNHRQAGRELRHVIQRCVGTWASCFDSILLELSGGLDSAVVLACLAQLAERPNIVCENQFTENAEGDEREFARQAATSANVGIVETAISPADRSLSNLIDTTCATPAHTVLLPATQAVREEIVEVYNVNAVFSGQGGDHFFQRSRTPHIAAEYAWNNGLRRDLFRVVSDTSRFTSKPIWSVVTTVILSGLLRRQVDPYSIRIPSPLMSRQARASLLRKSICHPWVDEAADLPGSKRQQIFHVVDSQMFYHIPGHYADIVHPLISQPIIELCLKVPSYVLTYGGIDRALIRDAFAGVVPASILARTCKGATTGYILNLLVRNIDVMRKLLLDGLLVRENLLDSDETSKALSEPSLISDSTLLFPVLNAFRAELWVRSWACGERRVS